MLAADVVFLVRMLAATSQAPSRRVKVASLWQPIFTDVLRTRRNPRESLTATA